jgi:hypothetical protein
VGWGDMLIVVDIELCVRIGCLGCFESNSDKVLSENC